MAVKFAALGCHLVLWDISERGNQETAKEVKGQGAKVSCYQVDLSKREQVYQTAEKVKEEIGHVDILINNAGIVTGKKFLDCPDSMIQKTIEVNSCAHFWTVKSFLPEMIERNQGHIVTMASSAGILGLNGLADYCASKFAAVGFDESIRFELEVQGKTDIHTTVICPYAINTGMFDGVESRFSSLLPILEPDYVASTIVDAILINQQVLYIPKLLYVMLGLKGILPAKCNYILCRFFGATALMDKFVGRQRSEGAN
ncbi:epidermal retinol dehydrogenase 2-like isoform X2 [Liolophura sinensis]